MGLWPLAGAVALWLVLWVAPVGPGVRRVLALAVWVGALWLARDGIDRWFFSRFEVDIGGQAEVVDGHEFRLRSPGFFFAKRRFRLAEVRPPTAPELRRRAGEELAALLRAGKVRIEIVEIDPRDPAVWQVRLVRGGRDLTRDLVAAGWLVAADAAEPEPGSAVASTEAASAEPVATTADELPPPLAADARPWWERDRARARWIAWTGLGALGVLGVGLLRNAVAFGGGLALAAVASALYDLWRAQRIGESLAPPLLALTLVALFGGWCAVRLRPLVEALREEAGK